MYIMLSIIQANFDYLNYAQAIVATRTLIRAVKTSLSNVISHTVPLQSSSQRPQVDKLSLVARCSLLVGEILLPFLSMASRMVLLSRSIL